MSPHMLNKDFPCIITVPLYSASESSMMGTETQVLVGVPVLPVLLPVLETQVVQVPEAALHRNLVVPHLEIKD